VMSTDEVAKIRGASIERLPVHSFQETIRSDRYSCVIFGAKDCQPCISLKESLSQVIDKFPQIDFYEFHVRALGGKEIAKGQRVNYMPRTIFYKSGKEVGRLLFHKTPPQLEYCFNELLTTGRILAKMDDVEEVTKFHEPVREAMGIDWGKVPRENWPEICEQWQKKTLEVIQKNLNWSVLTVPEIRELLEIPENSSQQ